VVLARTILAPSRTEGLAVRESPASAAATGPKFPERRAQGCGLNGEDRSGGGATAWGWRKGQAAAAPRPGGRWADHDPHSQVLGCAGRKLLQAGQNPPGETASRTWASPPAASFTGQNRADRQRCCSQNDRATAQSKAVQPPPAQPPQLRPAQAHSRFSSAGWPRLSTRRPLPAQGAEAVASARALHQISGVATTIVDPLLRQGG